MKCNFLSDISYTLQIWEDASEFGQIFFIVKLGSYLFFSGFLWGFTLFQETGLINTLN